jgi:hypothetical protein
VGRDQCPAAHDGQRNAELVRHSNRVLQFLNQGLQDVKSLFTENSPERVSRRTVETNTEAPTGLLTTLGLLLTVTTLCGSFRRRNHERLDRHLLCTCQLLDVREASGASNNALTLSLSRSSSSGT